MDLLKTPPLKGMFNDFVLRTCFSSGIRYTFYGVFLSLRPQGSKGRLSNLTIDYFGPIRDSTKSTAATTWIERILELLTIPLTPIRIR